jgi:hypothetical protein
MGAIARLGLALAIGLLVGFKRGWQERNELDRLLEACFWRRS